MNDDRGAGTGPIPGASGKPENRSIGEGSAGDETIGPIGDRGIIERTGKP